MDQSQKGSIEGDQSFAASIDAFDAELKKSFEFFRPPKKLSLSEWADEKFYLSSETSAVPGPWRTLPYQREIMDSITDPDVSHVTLIKSARVGYTLMISAAIGYYIEHEPSSIMVIQPTVDDAKNFGKEVIMGMVRDVPSVGEICQDMFKRGTKTGSQTLLHKTFPGGVLSLVGANSGAGFRRVSRRIVLFDEVDAYPPSAGNDGDQIKLGSKRAEAFHDRKIIAGSTPLVHGASRIEEMYGQGDKRRYHVPCPHCGTMDYLVFRRGSDGRGHYMRWDEGDASSAHFVCSACTASIDHYQKKWMVERGEWVPQGTGRRGHRSYSIWTAYSYSPNATWESIVEEYESSMRTGPEAVRTFYNTTLGETFKLKGESPPWETLYHRREEYRIGSVPQQADIVCLTAGVDVQKDRLVYEIVGWQRDKTSWSIDAAVIGGDTSDASGEVWTRLDELLAASYDGYAINMLAIDAGYNGQCVYGWARRYPMSRVVAVRGIDASRTMVGTPVAIDITVGGRRMQKGYKFWPLGVSLAKAELYGWLGLRQPLDGEEYPPGWCHFPEYSQQYFRQLTSEHMVIEKSKRGVPRMVWAVTPGEENHYLDCRIYARCAAAILGLDRIRKQERDLSRSQARPPRKANDVKEEKNKEAQPSRKMLKRKRKSSWLNKNRL